MKIRIIQWNIRINSSAEAISALIRSLIQGPVVVHLQEVSEAAFSVLCSELKPDGYAFSLSHRPAGKNEGRNRRMGVATLTFKAKLIFSHLVDRSVFPERTLVSQIEYDSMRIITLNFHSLTGVGYKKAKSSNFASLADFLESEKIDFICCDANEPKIDSLRVADTEFFDNGDKGRCAAMIFGNGAKHDLCDSFRLHLNNTGESGESIPIAVSHVVAGQPRRYDHILHAPRWHVESMFYDYKSAMQASSDHAIVVADFVCLPFMGA
jgi:hypothetical protein